MVFHFKYQYIVTLISPLHFLVLFGLTTGLSQTSTPRLQIRFAERALAYFVRVFYTKMYFQAYLGYFLPHHQVRLLGVSQEL